MQAIFKKGDIVFIKPYDAVIDHCCLPKDVWEDMYNKELQIIEVRRNTHKNYYKVEFDSDIGSGLKAWHVTEESLVNYNYYSKSLPDICDMI